MLVYHEVLRSMDLGNGKIVHTNAIEAWMGVEVQLYSFSVSALHTDKQSALSPDRFTPGTKPK
jgi:hypothetical protein